MKRLMALTVLLAWSASAAAQGYGEPLTIQGLDHTTLQSAAARALGGTSTSLRNDVGVMFLNPAGLQSLAGLQVSIGGVHQQTSTEQIQQYGPMKYYSNLSLLLEGLTVYIPDPDTSLPGINAGDTVQRAFDTIAPNWSRSADQGLPLQGLLAVPFALGEWKFVAGAGAVQYANLDHYYQNNNVLSPSILSVRPLPVPLPPNDSVPVITDWSQFIQAREGTMYGYGGALSAAMTENLAVGVSGLVLDGSSDDLEQTVSRGRLTFYRNFFRLDSVYGRTTSTGTSDYSGVEFTFSGMYRTGVVSLALALKPPMTITRDFTSQVSVDTPGTQTAFTVTGEDRLELPWRGTLGLSVMPHERLAFGLEYEFRSATSAVYRHADGTTSNPWLSAPILRFGIQYDVTPWLHLRGGIRGQAEVFEPEGNPLEGEPVSSSVYAGGIGVEFEGIRMNVAYEYAALKYEDVWNGAVSINKEKRHTLVADIAYTLPWMP